MKINIAKSAGFCTGVKRALNIAKKTARGEKKAYMLGDIVHNKEVIREIEKKGIKKIKKLNLGKNKVLLIRAHGAPGATYKKAKKLGYQIIDATCPMVKEIHKIARTHQEKKFQIIIIGDKKHEEVQGISGQLKEKAKILDPKDNFKKEDFTKIKKAAVVTQSTQNAEKVEKIVQQLKKQIPRLKFINTICAPTQKKQNEIKKMPRDNDVMIIIGSKMSANTKRLYQISKEINPRSYWIENEGQINSSWLKKAQSAGITAGSSTPQASIEKTIKKIKSLSKKTGPGKAKRL